MNHGLEFDSYAIAWTVGLPVAYFALAFGFKSQGWFPGYTRKGSFASDIMAFEIVAGFCVTYLAIAGLVAWFNLDGLNTKELLSADPMYKHSVYIEKHLAVPMLIYQAWDVVFCIINNDLRDPAMIGHHFVTASLAYFGLAPYLHYYALFFFGVAELTNIPLTFVDMFKYFPDLAKKYDVLNQFMRVSFVVTFVFLRLIYWPICCYPFWVESIELIRSGRAHSNFVVGFFLAANIFLTGLQYLWGSKLLKFLFPSKKGKKGVEDEKIK